MRARREERRQAGADPLWQQHPLSQNCLDIHDPYSKVCHSRLVLPSCPFCKPPHTFPKNPCSGEASWGWHWLNTLGLPMGVSVPTDEGLDWVPGCLTDGKVGLRAQEPRLGSGRVSLPPAGVIGSLSLGYLLYPGFMEVNKGGRSCLQRGRRATNSVSRFTPRCL